MASQERDGVHGTLSDFQEGVPSLVAVTDRRVRSTGDPKHHRGADMFGGEATQKFSSQDM